MLLMTTARPITPAEPPVAVAGLNFPSNGEAGGNIQLEWPAGLVPRFSHTAIWRYRPRAQLSYYATTWISRTDNTWGGGPYEYGTHFYPSNGNVNTDGTAVAFDANFHCWEIADGNDVIMTPPTAGGFLVTPFSAWDTWLLQARKCEQVGSDYVHTFWPDIENNPSLSIVWTRPTSNYPSPPTMQFYFGASKWTSSGTTNTECPSGIMRFFVLLGEGLSLSEVQMIGARTTNLTTAIDSRCLYSNISPTPTDVSDKSGAGNNPSWSNANRPTLWTP